MPDEEITDYRYGQAKRKNNPPAGLAPEGKIKEAAKVRFDYNPHLPPTLRFDPSGKSDKLPELLAKARTAPLSAEDAQVLADALQNRQPWLEWTGKREAQACEVDPVALHIHERVSAQAILRVAARQDVARNLFADPEQEYREAVQFYQHDIDWTNRLILGDSLQVMASLAKREDLAGKVQCVYMDPPYGIKYASNFQSEVGKRDVKDKPEDLTREPEMVKVYRDTWTLGVHSYLAYLRDRLYLVKELLTDSGSVFVQISDENLHRVRMIMDEVFDVGNFCSQISFVTTGGFSTTALSNPCNYLLWYSRNREQMKFRQLYRAAERTNGEGGYRWVALQTGETRGVWASELRGEVKLPYGALIYKPDNIKSSGGTQTEQVFEYRGKQYKPGVNNHWKTTVEGLVRLGMVGRIHVASDSIAYVRYPTDFPVQELSTLWSDTATGNFTGEKLYVV